MDHPKRGVDLWMQGTSWVSIALSVCLAGWLIPHITGNTEVGMVISVGFCTFLQGAFLIFLVGVPAFLCKRKEDEFMPAWAILPFWAALFILLTGFVALVFIRTTTMC